jgi:uncharacterized protein (DUF1800 family)
MARTFFASGVTMARQSTALSLLGLLLATCSPIAWAGLFSNFPSGDASINEYGLLNRLSYGGGIALSQDLHARGTDAWLKEQLHFQGDAALPAPLAQTIRKFMISGKTGAGLAREFAQDEAAAQALKGEERTKAEQANREKYGAISPELNCRRVLRSLYSDHPLQEKLTEFWFNHFTVFMGKADLRLWVPDYEEAAIRPHVLGKFRDLLLASLTHPAMILYLDNERNAKGALNENYARELLELHTLGVDGGYSQKDVQELARVLTGLGVDASGKPLTIKPDLLAHARIKDGFVFNPARHDTGDKILFGRTFAGAADFSEIERVVDLLASHPATAHHISYQLAQFFLDDTPPRTVVDNMSPAFMANDGDIAGTLEVLFHSPEFARAIQTPRKFKNPIEFVYSGIKVLYGDTPVSNCEPVRYWLGQLGGAIYGKRTPEGYPLTAAPWQGTDQIMNRFEVARSIVSSSVGLYVSEETRKAIRNDPTRTNELDKLNIEARLVHSPNVLAAYEALRPRLSPGTRSVLEKATTLEELGSYLLISPEFMYH